MSGTCVWCGEPVCPASDRQWCASCEDCVCECGEEPARCGDDTCYTCQRLEAERRERGADRDYEERRRERILDRRTA